MADLDEVDAVAVQLPFSPLAWEGEGEVKKLDSTRGGSCHKDSSVGGQAD